MQNSKYLIAVIIVLIIGTGLGFSIGKNQGTQAGLEQGRSESKTKIDELNKALDFFIPQPPAEIFSVSGEVKSITGNTLSLEIISPSERALPGTELKKETRTVTVAPTTKLSRFNPLAIPTIDPKTKLPVTPKAESIRLSDLKVGDRVIVSAKENIKEKQAFEASEVQLQTQ